MPRPAGTNIPSYRLHRRSGQAIVTLVDRSTRRRRDFLLGRFDSPESRVRYDQLIAAWQARGHRLPSDPRVVTDAAGISVRALCQGYEAYIEPLISPSHFKSIRNTLRGLKAAFGDTSAATFGPRKLKQLREGMAHRGLARKTINKRVRLIVSAFEWSVSEEMISETIHRALATVKPLRPGEHAAKESVPIRPVPDADIAAVRAVLPPVIQAMIDLQLLTGMRPGEVCAMRPVDLDTTGKLWCYRPPRHKNAWRGRDREVWIGPNGRRVIEPFLANRRSVEQPLFSPCEAYAQRRRANAAGCRREGQPETKRRSDRTMGEQFDAGTYGKAIRRACEDIGVPVWTPNRLRHTAATRIRRECGLEAAALVLGHSSAVVTDAVYAQRDRGKLCEVVARVG